MRSLAVGLLGSVLLAAQALAQQEAPRRDATLCPLPAVVAVTFLHSQCSRVVLTKPTTFYRYFSSDSNRYGRYLTPDRYRVNRQVIRSLALHQDWGNQAFRSLRVTLPAGTTVYQGVVAPQTPSACYPGGGQQIFIENSNDPHIQWIEDVPLTIQPFSCP